MMINNNHADEYEEVEEDQCPVVVVKSQMDMDQSLGKVGWIHNLQQSVIRV